jgi:transcriptional regulator with GAF, ATPase, and Fis domain
VGAGRFREDLYFRLSRPEVELPPLRHRKAEIPWLIAQVLRAIPEGPTAHASFVEACLLRFWPGNVRELLTEVRAAGQMAMAASKRVIAAQHLAPTAGQAFAAEPPKDHPALCPQAQSGPSRELIERVLQRTAGNISAAARLLGMHRTQLKRIMDRLGIDATAFTGTSGQE